MKNILFRSLLMTTTFSLILESNVYSTESSLPAVHCKRVQSQQQRYSYTNNLGETETKSFFKMPGDGNCFLWSIGLENGRKEAVEIWMQHANNEDIRKQVSHEIAFIIKEHLFLSSMGESSLQNYQNFLNLEVNYDGRNQSITQIIGKINSDIPDDQKFEVLKTLCSRSEIYESYVLNVLSDRFFNLFMDRDGEQNTISTFTKLLAFHFRKNLKVYNWDERNQSITLQTSYGNANHEGTLEVLFYSQHYSRLVDIRKDREIEKARSDEKRYQSIVTENDSGWGNYLNKQDIIYQCFCNGTTHLRIGEKTVSLVEYCKHCIDEYSNDGDICNQFKILVHNLAESSNAVVKSEANQYLMSIGSQRSSQAKRSSKSKRDSQSQRSVASQRSSQAKRDSEPKRASHSQRVSASQRNSHSQRDSASKRVSSKQHAAPYNQVYGNSQNNIIKDIREELMDLRLMVGLSDINRTALVDRLTGISGLLSVLSISEEVQSLQTQASDLISQILN